MTNLENQVVIITGTSSGFGKQATKDFAAKGAKVFATMRNTSTKNADNKTELESYSSNISVVEMDVTNDNSVTEAINGILSKEEKVDILINNAGIMYIGVTEAQSVTQAHEQMNTNYYGAIRVMQAVLPNMRKLGKGLIINTTSVVGRVAFPFGGTYNASKFALEAYSQCLKYEVASKGVEVVLVEPGPFGTGLIAGGQEEDRTEVLAENQDLAEMRANMMNGFDQFLSGEEAPKLQDVVDAYVKLAEMEHGTRPTRTVVGLDYGVVKINELTQPIQDGNLKDMGFDFMLETKVN